MTLQEALNRIQETLESRKRDLEGVKERLERELAEEEQKKEWHQLHKEVKFSFTSHPTHSLSFTVSSAGRLGKLPRTKLFPVN